MNFWPCIQLKIWTIVLINKKIIKNIFINISRLSNYFRDLLDEYAYIKGVNFINLEKAINPHDQKNYTLSDPLLSILVYKKFPD